MKDSDGNYSEDDENFSSLVSIKNNQVLPEINSLMHTKGKISMVFTA